jgi:hypothetical protein
LYRQEKMFYNLQLHLRLVLLLHPLLLLNNLR